MQNYKPNLNDPVEITFSQLIEKVNNNFESQRSNFSGETPPEDFCVGQLHYSTADKKLILKTEDGNFALMLEGSFTTDMIEETETREFITPEEKTKLSGIEESANNYAHPETHSADMIEETEDKLFITQHQQSLFDLVENLINTGDGTKFLADDGNYKEVSGSGGIDEAVLKKHFLI